MSPDDNPPMPTPRLRRTLGFLARWMLYLLGSLWAFGAIYFDGPMRPPDNMILAVPWAAVTVTFLLFLRGRSLRFSIWLLCFVAVLVPWLLKQPSNDRDWHPEWAQTGWTEIDGDVVTLHEFRNFDHGLDGTMTERWETRTVHLSNLEGLDYFHNSFFNGLLSHPLLSFDFGPDGHVVLNISTRREAEEKFSMFGGLYKMFELSYHFGDERDFIRLRTGIRGEPLYLYRTSASPELAREMFLDAVKAQKDLLESPRWYHVVTANCTSSLRAQTVLERRARFDYRMLANGKLDELIYERDGFVTGGLSIDALREQALINEVATEAHDDPDFPARIREGRAGF